MASSDTEVANMTLSHLGSGVTIGTLETDRTNEARTIRTHYETEKKAVLREFDWPFATKFAELALVTDQEDAAHPVGDEWYYSYRYPSDCVKIRRLLSGSRQDTQDSRIRHKVAKDASGKLILTDLEDAEIEYTENVSDETLYTDDFVRCFSLRLAAVSAPQLTSGDKFKMQDRMELRYRQAVNQAKANALNEEQEDREPESEFIRARE